jgi:hypothetical protein
MVQPQFADLRLARRPCGLAYGQMASNLCNADLVGANWAKANLEVSS